jgi:hypothetical protein
MKLKKIVMGKYYILCIFFLLLTPIISTDIPICNAGNQVEKMITIVSLDNNNEIITFISGSYCNVRISKRGFIRDVEIFAGSAGTLMGIRGWRYPPLQRYHELNYTIYSCLPFYRFF